MKDVSWNGRLWDFSSSVATKQNKKKEGYKLAVWFAIAIRTARLLI